MRFSTVASTTKSYTYSNLLFLVNEEAILLRQKLYEVDNLRNASSSLRSVSEMNSGMSNLATSFKQIDQEDVYRSVGLSYLLKKVSMTDNFVAD